MFEESAIASPDETLSGDGANESLCDAVVESTTTSSGPADTADLATNPLLDFSGLPDFARIEARHVLPAVEAELARSRQTIDRLLAQPRPTFSNLIVPIEVLNYRLSRVFAPVAQLAGVMDTEQMRDAHNEALGLIAEHGAEVGQNVALYQAYVDIEKRERHSLSPDQHRLLTMGIDEFHLAGVHLPTAAQERHSEISEQIAVLEPKFDDQLLDAAKAWSRPITSTAELAGLQPHVVERARATAQERGLEGWVLTLDSTNYDAVISHADSAWLRKEIYEAWMTRASDQGPHAGHFDNTDLIVDLVRLRHESAQILGFAHYAALSLSSKMAGNVEVALAYLNDLVEKYRPLALRELKELEQYAGRELAPWDIAYYSRKLCEERFEVSEEQLRAWFTLPKVLDGAFTLVNRLYGVTVQARADVPVWHPDAQYFEVTRADGSVVGGFYADWFTRNHKAEGSWMGEMINRISVPGLTSLPVATLVCNFTPPEPGRVAQLTQYDVITLFHELGHVLHHVLTTVDYPSVSGSNGVPWDAVELPSQMFEEWAWRPEVLPLISAHVETGEPLPELVLNKLIASRNFQKGMAAIRQLEFGIFDLRLHASPLEDPAQAIAQLHWDIRTHVSVSPIPTYLRPFHSFWHIFSGEYAAGYYSYFWAEELSRDAFGAFEEAGVFDAATGHRFLRTLLARGGTRDMREAFAAFRGREAQAKPDDNPAALAA